MGEEDVDRNTITGGQMTEVVSSMGAIGLYRENAIAIESQRLATL